MPFFNLVKTNEHWQLIMLHEAGNINVVFAPSEYLHIMNVNLPLSAKSHIQKAVPFAIESHLAQPIEALHFVIGEQDKEGKVDVCVVNKALIKIWREVCQQAGYHNTIILPDIFRLPYDSAAWTILKIDSRYLIRTGQMQGLVLLQLEHLPLLLQEKPITIEKIINYSPNEDSLNYPVENRHFDKNMLMQLDIAALKSFDLLQGEFALETKNFSGLSQWKKVIYLVLAIMGIWGLGNGAKIYLLSKQQSELEQQILRAYRYYFPDSAEIIDPELRLKNLSQDDKAYDPKYLTILSILHAALKSQQQVQLKNIEFTKDKMLLTFNEISEDFFTLLEGQLQAQGKTKQQDKQHIWIEWGN